MWGNVLLSKVAVQSIGLVIALKKPDRNDFDTEPVSGSDASTKWTVKLF